MLKTHIRKAARYLIAQLERFDSRFELCLQGWKTRYRFSALALFFVLPVACLAKRHVERRIGTDLYVMF